MKKLTALAAVAAIGLFSHVAHSAELLTNGSFESLTALNADGYCYGCGTIEGWSGATMLQVASNSAPWGQPGALVGFDASFGAQVAGIQNNSTMEQTITGSGGLYTLSWYDAGRLYDDGQTYSVSFGGTTIGTFGVNSGQGWSLNSFTFTAAAGSQMLSFAGVGSQTDGTVFLDKVSLTGAPAVSPVPEPESLAMMLVGLGVLGGVARRQRKAV